VNIYTNGNITGKLPVTQWDYHYQ